MCYNLLEGEREMARPRNGFDKKAYDTNYHRENTKFISLGFKTSETDILNKLASVPNKTEYIRQLILADIEKEKTNHEG